VFLADAEVSFYTAAAGRKVVALNEIFANPYVNAKRRTKDALSMLRALRAGDVTSFSKRSKRYSVKYVVLPSNEPAETMARFDGLLRRVAALPRHAIYRIDPSAEHASR